MNQQHPQETDFLKTVQLIHTAITLGLVAFGAVVLFMMISGQQTETVDASATKGEDTAFILLGIAGPIIGTGFAFIVRMLLGRGAGQKNDRGPLVPGSTVAMMRHIIFIAALEGGGLFGVVMSFVSGHPAGLIAALLPLIILIATWPTRARFDPDYDPRDATADWSTRE